MLKALVKARNSKKGFTMVELIVVLVILAILLAILVPSLTGYIDKAQSKAFQLETHNVYLAAQTIASEIYASKVKNWTQAGVDVNEPAFPTTYSAATPAVASTITEVLTAIYNLAEVVPTATKKISTIKVVSGKITEMSYTDGSWTATLTGGAWSYAKVAAAEVSPG